MASQHLQNKISPPYQVTLRTNHTCLSVSISHHPLPSNAPEMSQNMTSLFLLRALHFFLSLEFSALNLHVSCSFLPLKFSLRDPLLPYPECSTPKHYHFTLFQFLPSLTTTCNCLVYVLLSFRFMGLSFELIYKFCEHCTAHSCISDIYAGDQKA